MESIESEQETKESQKEKELKQLQKIRELSEEKVIESEPEEEIFYSKKGEKINLQNFTKKQLYHMLVQARKARDEFKSLMFKPMIIMYYMGFSVTQLSSFFTYSKIMINNYINGMLMEFGKTEEGKAQEKIVRKIVVGRARALGEKLGDINKLYWCNNYIHFMEHEVPIPIDYSEFELANIDKDIKSGLKKMKQRFSNLDIADMMKWILKNASH